MSLLFLHLNVYSQPCFVFWPACLYNDLFEHYVKHQFSLMWHIINQLVSNLVFPISSKSHIYPTNWSSKTPSYWPCPGLSAGLIQPLLFSFIQLYINLLVTEVQPYCLFFSNIISYLIAFTSQLPPHFPANRPQLKHHETTEAKFFNLLWLLQHSDSNWTWARTRVVKWSVVGRILHTLLFVVALIFSSMTKSTSFFRVLLLMWPCWGLILRSRSREKAKTNNHRGCFYFWLYSPITLILPVALPINSAFEVFWAYSTLANTGKLWNSFLNSKTKLFYHELPSGLQNCTKYLQSSTFDSKVLQAF